MWIRNLVIRNRVGDLQLGIESYQTKINLERPNWDAADYYFKEDYTIVPKPRAVVYRDRNDQRKLMRLNELHKFSDGTLTRVMEKLDQMVKDFHLYEYNKGMETRKWSEDDKRRSKDFITAIEKRLQIRRIYRSLESFVGGRIRDIDYRLINRTTIRWQNKIFPLNHRQEQIIPHSHWSIIGKSNLIFNAQKIQKNPIFQISVDILSNTNFFRAFTASASIPAIYVQQFWNTMKYDEKTGVYSCQVDEQWFDLSADLLRKALAITPVVPAHPFELPPSGNTVIDFVNELGYPEPVEIVSNIRVNYVYQPWRAILTLINQCLTGKTSGSDKPRHPVLQMLWGIVTQTNVDHAELLWEEFTQGIQTFFSHKASHKTSLKNPKKKEVDINKKTENQAKMTKLSMEWKRLCKIKAKVQKCQSHVRIQAKTLSKSGKRATAI
ncbi:hypothetical protein Tco_1253045 [Tanacetum coccineum]